MSDFNFDPDNSREWTHAMGEPIDVTRDGLVLREDRLPLLKMDSVHLVELNPDPEIGKSLGDGVWDGQDPTITAQVENSDCITLATADKGVVDAIREELKKPERILEFVAHTLSNQER